MSNWILRATEDYLVPVYQRLHEELVNREVLHADKTSLQVLWEAGKLPQSNSYMWLFRTSGDTENPIVLYRYQPGRSVKHPKEFLTGFKGYLHTDGYAGYYNLPRETVVVGCWTHARRKFDEAGGPPSCPRERQRAAPRRKGWRTARSCSIWKEQFADLSPEERYEKRLELSNNRAEWSIKPFVIDRKNFLFANTPKGAKGSAIMFSLIQTAIENGLDPYRYLTWLLKTANISDLEKPDVVEKQLPWNAPVAFIAYQTRK